MEISGLFKHPLTVKETAEYLRIPLPTVYYLVQRGRIPAIQIGGRWRIKKSAAQSTVPRKGPRQLRETIARWLGRQAVQDRLLQIAEARRTISPLHRLYSSVRMWFLRRDVQQPRAAKSKAQLFHFRHPKGYECGPPRAKTHAFRRFTVSRAAGMVRCRLSLSGLVVR